MAEMARLKVEDLRRSGVPEPAIDGLRGLGRVEHTEGGEFITLTVAGLVATLIIWLVAGTISTWVFASVLHQIGVAPWQIWE